MTLTLRYAAQSDRGLIRDLNQDSVYAGPRLLAVADGMGGMAAGDVASNIVIAAMRRLDEDVPGDALVDALRTRSARPTSICATRRRQPAASRAWAPR
jgi:protein phosphatase